MQEPASMPLAGRVAFITGAAGGLGQAMTTAFAAQGAAVALADLPARANQLAELAQGHPRALPVELDVRDTVSIRNAVQATVDGLGSLDIMVCNAGLNVRKTKLLDATCGALANARSSIAPLVTPESARQAPCVARRRSAAGCAL